ncbi:MAG TPA: mercury methylation corrinoid protein HgcA [Methanocellaceae archaeon]
MSTETVQKTIITVSSDLALPDRLDHFLARIGYKRGDHRVNPGLYAIGKPTPDSPVFVTANYRLSFDALRSNLVGVDCYILVLNTFGINVWCAAGKGTFGTDELVNRIKVTGLENVVSHRKVILPQLGAAGVSAFTVKKECGWQVEYGPVKAADLKEYLQTHKASAEMRTVRFGIWDRIVLIPMEVKFVLLWTAVAAVILYLAMGLAAAIAAVAAVFAGTVLFPVLLPYIPVKDFSAKGLILGLIVALPFAYDMLVSSGPAWPNALAALGYVLAMPPVTAYLALNFTGSSTFTSRTGVRKEIYRYIPPMAVLFIAGILIFAGLFVARLLKVI